MKDAAEDVIVLDSWTGGRRKFLSIGVSAIALIAVSLATLLIFGLQPLPIAGEGSIGQHGAIVSAFAASGAFVVGRLVSPYPYSQQRFLNTLDIAAVASAHAMIALLSWTLVANIFERAFLGAMVFGLPSVITAGAMAAITAQVAFYSSAQMRPTLLSAVLAIFFVEGVVASMLAASDPRWWRDDFSALGATDDPSAFAFNVTLIVAGLIVTILARYTPISFSSPHQRGVVRVRVSLVIIGISLAMVGAFPADAFYWVHTGFALAMAATFAILVFLLPRWLPAMPVTFFVIGWLMIGVIFSLFVLLAVGDYTLTAVEFVAGTLVLAWINLFVRGTAELRQNVGEESGFHR